MYWFDLLAVQATLKSLLLTTQFKIINSLVISFLLDLTLTSIHDYWRNHSFDLTFVSKVVSLLFHMLSCFVIAFLPRIKCLLNFMAAVTICSDLGAPQNKVCHCCHCLPIYLP